jgi:hypothetical protein
MLRRGQPPVRVSDAVQDLAENPADPDLTAAFRVQLRKQMATDPELATDLAEILRQATTSVTASGDGGGRCRRRRRHRSRG